MFVEPSGRTRAGAGSGVALDVGRGYASDAAKPGVTPGAVGDVTPTCERPRCRQTKTRSQGSRSVNAGRRGVIGLPANVTERQSSATKVNRSEENTSELKTLKRTSYASLCLK